MNDPDPYAVPIDHLAPTEQYSKLLYPYAKKLRIPSPLEHRNQAGAQYADLITPAQVTQHLTSQNRGPSTLFRLFPLKPRRTSPATPLPGDAETQHALFVTAYCQSYQLQPRRPLTEEELAAVVEHTSSAVNINAAAGPGATAVALWFWYRGMRTLRVPGYTPRLTFPPFAPSAAERKRFPLPANASVIRLGSWPIWLGLQALRFVLYGVICDFSVAPLFTSYAHTRTTAAISMDRRLNALREHLRQQARLMDPQQQHEGVSGGRLGQQQQGQQQGQLTNPYPDTGSRAGGSVDQGALSQEVDADNNPEVQEEARNTAFATRDREVNHRIRAGNERLVRANETGSKFGGGRPREQQEKDLVAWDADPTLQAIIDDGDDDASPVASSARLTQKVPQKQPRAQRQRRPAGGEGTLASNEDSSMSPWERVRQKAQEEANTRNQGSGS